VGKIVAERIHIAGETMKMGMLENQMKTVEKQKAEVEKKVDKVAKQANMMRGDYKKVEKEKVFEREVVDDREEVEY
jgi:hypothetical protein